jgi:hypothetical protein
MGDTPKHIPGPDIDALVRAFVRREALLDGADVEATLGDFAKVVADACQTERATLAAQLAEAVGLLMAVRGEGWIDGTDIGDMVAAFLARIDGDGKDGA